VRVATWAIQERERAVSRAAARLGRRGGADPAELLALLDVVSRALMARLTGAGVHDATVRELRERYGAARLTGAAHAVAAELRDLVDTHGGADAERTADRRALTDAVDAVVNAFEPEGAEPVELDDVPRPTLVAALSEHAVRPLSSAEMPRPPRALLRVRASRADAAHVLRDVGPRLVRAGSIALEPSAPDELLLTTSRDGADGVERLVRAAAELANLPELARDGWSAALVRAHGDIVDAALAAAELMRVGLLTLDEPCWTLFSPSAAPAPGHERAVDPRAPFSTDRLEQSALLQRPALCGRADSVAQLAQWLLAPTAGAGLAVLHGPVGIGKTSLVRAALNEAGYDDDEAPVLWGSADAGVPTPYAALHAMLRAAANAPLMGPPPRARIERMITLLAASLPPIERRELTGAVRALLAVIGEGDEEEARAPRALRLAIRRAFVLLLRALWERGGAARPVVLVVTQADCLDGATREVLALAGSLLLGRLRVVLVTSHKPRATPALDAAFERRVVQVPPLGRDDVRELASQMLGGTADEELVALMTRTKGVPLATLHAMRLVVECGWLRPGDGLLAHPAARDVPVRVDRLLAQRLARLPAEQQRMLSVCALFGAAFSIDAVELLGVRAGLGRDDVMHALTVLVDTGFLARVEPRPARPLFRESRDGGGETYCFEHPTLRTAALEMIPSAERSALHALVAEAIEALAAADSTALAAQLAQLHRLAGRADRALPAMFSAARRCARLDDRQGAVELARAAIELCGEDAAAAFPFRKEMCRLREQGPRGVHRAALEELMRCADATQDPRRRAEALLSVARYNLRFQDPELAGRACARALEELRGLGDARLELAVMRVLAVTRAALVDIEYLERLQGEILARTPSTDSTTRAALSHLVGSALLAVGDIAGAVDAFNHALADARTADDPAAEASCLESLALAFGQADRPDVALALVERAQRRLDLVGDVQGRGRLLLVRAELMLAAGDESGALAAAERARETSRASDDDASELAALLVQARAYLARAEAFMAEPILETLRKRARDDHTRAALAAAIARAKVLRAQQSAGTPRERLIKTATQRAREALTIADAGAASPAVVMQASAALAEALLLEGDAGAAFPHAQRAAEHVDDGPSGPWIEEALLASARVAAAMGDDEEHRDVLTRARDVLARRASRLDEATRARFYAAPVRAALRGADAMDAALDPASDAAIDHENTEAA
jgi:AAA ATPase domain